MRCFSYSLFLFGLSPLAFANNSLVNHQSQIVNDINQCPIPTYHHIDMSLTNIDESNFTILSNSAAIKNNQLARFLGGVKLYNHGKALVADELSIDQQTSTISAKGNVHLQNNGMDIFSSSLILNNEQKSTQLIDTSYQLSNSTGHGKAKEIFIDGENKQLTLNSSSFTTCYGENPDWQMFAGKIKISADQETIEAYNAKFTLFDVPVFYLPYISLPVSQKRRSGLLYPKFSSSNRSGLIFETPYYWNIAENMDATITPRYMTERGLQLITEFRYLQNQQSGKIDLEYLKSDEKISINDDHRYLARLQHIGTFADRYRLHIDYTKISDDNYLVDLGSDQYQSNDAYVYQTGELSYFNNNWRSTLKLQNFQVFGNNQISYKTLPQLEISNQQHFKNFAGIFDFYSEISSFDSDDDNLPTAQRYHVEAGLLYPIITPAWFLNSEIKLMHTHYRQQHIDLFDGLTKKANRTLPKFRIHSGINFDRQLNLFGYQLNQTLEPQIQYLYIGDKDQSNIGIYDTTDLQYNYNGLFRDRIFSGLDRIAKANQVSWGLTTRILSDKKRELMHFSFGRIVYIDRDNEGDTDEINLINFIEQQSALATEIFINLNKYWQLSSDIQYNTTTNKTRKSQTSLDYIFTNKSSLQLNHRYSREVSGITLEQISLATQFKITDQWQFVGRLTQDLQNKRSIESLAGLEYSSCCWGIRFSYHRNISSRVETINNIQQDHDTFDNGFKIEFVYNGINSKQSSNSVYDMFNASIFGYKRPYFLNN